QVPSCLPERILLLHPPVYDSRFSWSQWQRPNSLLKLGSYLIEQGADVRLIDTTYDPSSARLRRERVAIVDMDGVKVNRWRYGLQRSSLLGALKTFAKEGWNPELVVV